MADEPAEPQEPVEEPAAEEAVAESPVGEGPVAEPVAEETAVEEAIAAEEAAVEELAVEELVAEELAVEEAIVEELVEELVVEEAVAELVAEAATETPAEREQPSAEPAAQELAAEPAAEAEAEDEAEDDEDFDEEEEEPAPRVKPAVPGCAPGSRHRPRRRRPAGARGPGRPVRDRGVRGGVAEAEEEAEEESLTQPISSAAIDLAAGARYRATGKRKTAIARVILRPGSGTYLINGRTLEEHFPRVTLQRNIRQPLETVGYEERMDVVARLHGGGISAQAGALRHGVSRALLEADPNLRGELKRRGFLTRDSRAKERKKAGLKKARKRPQFSKR